MPHYGVLREYKLEEVDDVRGAEVYGVNDEKLGTIADVVFDHSNGEIRYIVLKTGALAGKRYMVPANRIAPYGHHDDRFYAELDKQRLEMLPEFNNEALTSESEWSNYEKDYEKRWNDGAVMYNKDTGRIVTPPAEQIPAEPGVLSQDAKESLQRDFTPQRLGKEDDYLGVADSGTGKTTLRPAKPSIAGREDAIRQSGRGQIVRPSGARQEIAGGPEVNHQTTGRENLHDETMSRSRVPGQRTREVEGVMSTEFEVSSSPESSPAEAMRQPNVYKLDPVPEAGQNAATRGRDVTEAPNEALNAKYGRRWTAFQKHLRDRRDKVVSGCNLCGTQEKVA